MAKILVTGSAGFIGSHFVDYCVEQGQEVVGVDDLSYGVRENVNPASKFIEADVAAFGTIEEIILSEKPDKIVHYAANATTKSSAMGWNDPMRDYQINMLGTLNLLEVVRKHELDVRVVYASTAAVYGEPVDVPIDEQHPTDPLSPYGVSKLAGEKYCYAYGKEWGLQITIFRIFNTFGPRQPRYVMYDQIQKMRANPDHVEVLGTGEQIRDYAYVSDVVRAFYLGMESPQAVGEIFNVAGGNKTSIKELIGVIQSVLGLDISPTFTGQSWKGDITRLWADTGKLQKTLGWRPDVGLEDGVRRLVDWMTD